MVDCTLDNNQELHMENLKEKKESKVAKPKQYVAVILNDDFTTFEAVEYILQKYFQKSFADAQVIALEVHKSGKGIAGGPYSFEVCEMKCYMAMMLAKHNEMPLLVSPQEA
jgi:ATP-dependent Clp protease adaptor protein ClpS